MPRTANRRRTPAAPTNGHRPEPVRGEVAFMDPRRLFPGGFAQYNPSWLVGRRGLRIFEQMVRDDQVKAALAFKKHTILASGWQVSSPEGQPKDWEVTRFVRHTLTRLDEGADPFGTFELDLLEVLSGLDYGFSITEMVWEEETRGDFTGKLVLKALKARSPVDIRFEQDEFGNLLPDGIVQDGNPRQPNGRLPAEKFVIYVHEARFGNLFGTSDLEAAYRAWWLKDNAYKWLAMLLERLGIPPVFGLYNPNNYTAAQIDDLKKVIQNLQAATFGVLPRPMKDALELWAPELAGQASRVFIPTLDTLNKDISRAILMPGLLGLTPDLATGSYARAQVQFDVFIEVVEHIRRTVQQNVVQNQIIRPLVDLNYANVPAYPIWRFMPISDEVRLDILDRWIALTGARITTPQEEDEVHVRTLLKFPEKQAGAPMPQARVPAESPDRDDEEGEAEEGDEEGEDN
jgi:phage gp29-like protein